MTRAPNGSGRSSPSSVVGRRRPGRKCGPIAGCFRRSRPNGRREGLVSRLAPDVCKLLTKAGQTTPPPQRLSSMRFLKELRMRQRHPLQRLTTLFGVMVLAILGGAIARLAAQQQVTITTGGPGPLPLGLGPGGAPPKPLEAGTGLIFGQT